MRVCPFCKFENTDDAVFCEECGRRLDEVPVQEARVTCAACGAGNKKGARFCINCGAALNAPPAAEDVAPAAGPQMAEPKKEEKKPRSKLQKFIIAEVLGIVVVAALFFGIGHMKYGAESIAERYLAAYADQDWHTMYTLLDLPEGSFMSESQFAELMAKEDAPSLSNYTIQPKPGADTSVTQDFEIEYAASGEDVATMDLTLVCDGDKELFVFDKWRVSSSAVLAKDYPIWVPDGAQVTVDGVELTAPSETASGMACYTVSIFKGLHALSVAMPWSEIYTAEIDTRATDSTTVEISDIDLTADGAQAMKAKAQQDLQKWFTAGMSGADYSEVKGLFTKEAGDEYEATYDKLVVALVTDPGGKYGDDYVVNGLSFSGLSFDLGTDSDGARTVEVAYEYTTDYTYKGERNTTSKSTEAVLDVSYVCEDGAWKIRDLLIT